MRTVLSVHSGQLGSPLRLVRGTLAQFVDQMVQLLQREIPVVAVTEQHDRRGAACAQALHNLEHELPVRGGLPGAHSELTLQEADHLFRPAKGARERAADLENVAAHGPAVIHRIERRDALDLGRRDAQNAGDVFNGFVRDVAVLLLGHIQGRQQCGATLGIARSDTLDPLSRALGQRRHTFPPRKTAFRRIIPIPALPPAIRI